MKNTILDADKDTVVQKISEAILRAWGETNSAIHYHVYLESGNTVTLTTDSNESAQGAIYTVRAAGSEVESGYDATAQDVRDSATERAESMFEELERDALDALPSK